MGDWNIACSYGAHSWVRSTSFAAGGCFFKACSVCGASYQCSAAEWHMLPEVVR